MPAPDYVCVCIHTHTHTFSEVRRNNRKAMKPLKYAPTDDEEEGGVVVRWEVLAFRNVMKPLKYNKMRLCVCTHMCVSVCVCVCACTISTKFYAFD